MLICQIWVALLVVLGHGRGKKERHKTGVADSNDSLILTSKEGASALLRGGGLSARPGSIINYN